MCVNIKILIILKKLVESKVKISEFLDYFESEEDRKYFEMVLAFLLKKEILVPIDQNNNDIDISLELTNRCNLRCKHCCVDACTVSQNNDMSTEEWKGIIDKLMELPIGMLTFTGGEPMLRTDFFDIVRYAKGRINAHYQLMTNGTFITEQNVDEIIKLFDDISISLDGADEESCASVRGNGVFERAMKSIKMIREKSNIFMSLSFTRVKTNIHMLNKFKELCKSLNAEPVIRHFDLVGRAKDNLELLPYDIDDSYLPYIKPFPEGKDYFPPESMPECISCGAVNSKLTIAYDGTIYPCMPLMYPEFNMGNVLNISSLKLFINDKKYEETNGYKAFCEYHPATSKECNDCHVKLFCDSCVQYMYLVKNHPRYHEFCAMKKEVLSKVWE